MQKRLLVIRATGILEIGSILVAMSLSGCGAAIDSSLTKNSPETGIAFAGKVMSGQQPIAQASIQMYAAGNTGYGTGASTLLSSPVMTAGDGSFTISGEYSCPSEDTQIYLTAIGGTTTQGVGSENPYTVLLSPVGLCGAIDTSTYVVLNELSTVSASYALQGFIGKDGQIGSSSSNVGGLKNSFGIVRNLINLATGTSPGASVPTGSIIPSAKLNTLAGILANCVGSAGGASCSPLFMAVSTAQSSVPKNTLDAVLNIVRNPSSNVTRVFALGPSSWPFKPVLSNAPQDWAVPISYAGGGLNGPTSVGIDSRGNVWAADYYNAVTEISPTGNPLSPPGGYTGGGLRESYGLTIDGMDNIWVANEESPYGVNSGYGTVTELNSTGAFLSGVNGYYQGGLSFPVSLAADTNGDIWVANFGDSSGTLLNSGGVPISGSGGYGAGAMAFPAAVAVDANHNAWFANQSSMSVTEVSPDGSLVKPIACCNGASGIAVDQFNNVWVANYFGNGVSQITTSGVVVSSGYTASSVSHPNGIVVDGAGNVWISNFGGNSISELLGASNSHPGEVIAPPNGYGADAGLQGPYGIAVDAGGNVWVSNFTSNTLTCFLGLATPTKTPSIGLPSLP